MDKSVRDQRIESALNEIEKVRAMGPKVRYEVKQILENLFNEANHNKNPKI